jgi:hypothetical protein
VAAASANQLEMGRHDVAGITGDSSRLENFVEELITTVILACFNVALDVKDIITHETQVPAYYEVEKSNNITEVKALPIII